MGINMTNYGLAGGVMASLIAGLRVDWLAMEKRLEVLALQRHGFCVGTFLQTDCPK